MLMQVECAIVSLEPLDSIDNHLLSCISVRRTLLTCRALLDIALTRRFTVYNAPVAKGANKTNIRKERKAEIQSDG